jgi:type II secretory pathway pseudopilin PulG
VELLVVIAIISLLASMLLPVLRRTRERARRIDCLSRLRQVYTIGRLYAGDAQGWYPARHVTHSSGYAAGYHCDDASCPKQWGRSWEAYMPKLDFDGKGPEILFCPGTYNNHDTWRPAYAPNWRNADMAYWSHLDTVCDSGGGISWAAAARPRRRAGGRHTGIPFATCTVMYVDQLAVGYGKWFVAAHPWSGQGKNSYDAPGADTSAAAEPEGTNQAHTDGSARWYRFRDLEPCVNMFGWCPNGQAYQYWGRP